MKSTGKRPSIKTRQKSKPRASTTLDILGASAPEARQPKIDAKWSRHYKNLLELRDKLLVQAGKLAKDVTEGTPTYSMHMADAGTDSFDRDFALSLLSSDQDALYEIEQAMKRIQTGAYGVCELTGKRIPKERLNAIPWTRYSAEAQLQLESDGVLKRKQLSAFSSLPEADLLDAEDKEDGAESEKE
jgi:RNA polymerase-binding transcription factor DksA